MTLTDLSILKEEIERCYENKKDIPEISLSEAAKNIIKTNVPEIKAVHEKTSYYSPKADEGLNFPNQYFAHIVTARKLILAIRKHIDLYIAIKKEALTTANETSLAAAVREISGTRRTDFNAVKTFCAGKGGAYIDFSNAIEKVAPDPGVRDLFTRFLTDKKYRTDKNFTDTSGFRNDSDMSAVLGSIFLSVLPFPAANAEFMGKVLAWKLSDQPKLLEDLAKEIEPKLAEQNFLTIKFRNNVLRDFINETFLFLKNEIDPEELIGGNIQKKGKHNGVDRLGISLPEYFGPDPFIGVFDSPQTEEDLKSGGTLRYFPADLNFVGLPNSYLTTQWADTSSGNLTLNNFRKYVEKVSAGKYTLGKENGEYLFIEKLILPNNVILYGAPGTGKSYIIKNRIKDKIFIRTTFHPEYTFGQFVGAYKPVTDATGKINYAIVPGPFLQALIKANQKKYEPVYLIIEELNRANVAAVFGDVFQLLDRLESGESEYGIAFNTDIMQFLVQHKVINSVDEEVRIPRNLFLYASMNSADQGVFPLDTAFKRRWTMEYVGLDQGQQAVQNKSLFLNQGMSISWNSFRNHLNTYLQSSGIQEDKLIGPFFLNDLDLQSGSGFSGKLILYLWDDVLRHKKRNILFKAQSLSAFHTALEKATDSNEFFESTFSETFLVDAPFISPTSASV